MTKPQESTLTVEQIESDRQWAEQLEAHIDECGKYSTANVLSLINMVKLLAPVARKGIEAMEEANEAQVLPSPAQATGTQGLDGRRGCAPSTARDTREGTTPLTVPSASLPSGDVEGVLAESEYQASLHTNLFFRELLRRLNTTIRRLVSEKDRREKQLIETRWKLIERNTQLFDERTKNYAMREALAWIETASSEQAIRAIARAALQQIKKKYADRFYREAPAQATTPSDMNNQVRDDPRHLVPPPGFEPYHSRDAEPSGDVEGLLGEVIEYLVNDCTGDYNNFAIRLGKAQATIRRLVEERDADRAENNELMAIHRQLEEANDEAQSQVSAMREALLSCSDLNIPFPDEGLPGGDTEFMRGVRKGHLEARAFCEKIACAALQREQEKGKK